MPAQSDIGLRYVVVRGRETESARHGQGRPSERAERHPKREVRFYPSGEAQGNAAEKANENEDGAQFSEAKAEEVAVAIKELLREIGRKDEKDPVSLLLDASLMVLLRDLAASRGAIEAKLNSAKDEVNDAKAKLKEDGEKLIEAKAKAGVTDPDALRLLGVLVVDVRKGGYEGAARLAAKTVAEKRQALADTMKHLVPWRGGPDDLGALKIPEAGVVAGWTADLDAADEAVKTAKAEKYRLEAELATQRAKRDASAASSGVISDGEAAQKRSDREAAWAEHRRKLDGETADAFEARLRADDVAVSLRFSHASEVAKVNATLEAVCLNEKLLEQADTVFKEAEERRQAARNGVAAAIQVVSGDLPSTMTPGEFENLGRGDRRRCRGARRSFER